MADFPTFAISVRQPWAYAIIHAGKDVENRVKRAITMGGMDQHSRLAIHAAAGMSKAEYEHARDFMVETCGVRCPHPSALVRGAIIGSVAVTGITKASDSKWFFGPWAIQLSEAQACLPIPCIGQLGAFRWARAGIDAPREPLPWMMAWPGKAPHSSTTHPSLFEAPSQ
ncbi:hypothetical protein [Croceicoccus mobilis]|uniref:ASCH domain-containing protein n=1 Tax=Croceicoccus mobilis TaxID=1703339 RepID=A0A916Z4F3_9SPHN|nr:hypothetical protein [Croceicoccus mobilis]GGD74091.1 hypothetical protein GCM10010990_24670 [Croceicoccus mobilis]